MDKKYSIRAMNVLEKTRKYTNTLSGVLASTLNPKSSNPIPSINRRRFDVSLNNAGGIGMYQMTAQMARKISMFSCLTLSSRYEFFSI